MLRPAEHAEERFALRGHAQQRLTAGCVRNRAKRSAWTLESGTVESIQMCDLVRHTHAGQLALGTGVRPWVLQPLKHTCHAVTFLAGDDREGVILSTPLELLREGLCRHNGGRAVSHFANRECRENERVRIQIVPKRFAPQLRRPCLEHY
jgi:hypothetical protein